MSRDFLSNFEKSKADKAETLSEPASNEENEYKGDEFVRNLYLVWPDGSQYFINYHRLDGGNIDPEYQNIKLNFGGEIIELVGKRLLPLFNSISTHTKKYIYCDDERYNELNGDDPLVNEIIVLMKNK